MPSSLKPSLATLMAAAGPAAQAQVQAQGQMGPVHRGIQHWTTLGRAFDSLLGVDTMSTISFYHGLAAHIQMRRHPDDTMVRMPAQNEAAAIVRTLARSSSKHPEHHFQALWRVHTDGHRVYLPEEDNADFFDKVVVLAHRLMPTVGIENVWGSSAPFRRAA